ncbi:AzlC family ABC transporter permease [Alicyclobacillus dauci]|uniref:AzlC family ABC transporter permease n=1 Tax=Alicyclobacillus dauci TaxID=1475485 RepID=A0ABY6Z6I3_9BACL|nr:AzlC family ABC transporter permease [Alicyclobacillus dauci]WAH37796.1 AzlC family ABC transporter permease [Alicyclobacillus dauci]
MNYRSEPLRGLRDSLPIMLAYFPIAITFGVLATSSGIPWLTTCLISVCVYAGSAQFMMASLALTGISTISMVITILLVNLRHFLYGTTLGPTFMSWAEGKKWIAAFGLTDEVFAVTSGRSVGETPSPRYQYTFSFACYFSWVAGTVVGASIGGIVPSAVSQVLSFALPSLFLALLLLGRRTLPYLISAICGGAIASLASLMKLGSVGIIAGAIVGATLGMAVQRWFERTSKATGQEVTS